MLGSASGARPLSTVPGYPSIVPSIVSDKVWSAAVKLVPR